LWQPSLVVSQQALNTFLTRPIDKFDAGSTHLVDQSEPSSNSQCQTSLNGVKSNGNETLTRPLVSVMEGEISVEEILCPHGRLDPGKAANMKRIDRVRPYPLSHIISLMFTNI
jgi:ubiquitin carboxyl-terminal hydrolase 48